MWVFGYGSLLWNPGFEFDKKEKARINGYRRSFCMWSIHHRGTVEKPGLVLALDQNEQSYCDGVGFKVKTGHEDQTLNYLRERELVSSAYFEKWLDIQTTDSGTQKALVYVINPEHNQYCDLNLSHQAHIIANAVGGRGPNTDYLFNTAQHLDELGLSDPDMTWLVQQVKEMIV